MASISASTMARTPPELNGLLKQVKSPEISNQITQHSTTNMGRSLLKNILMGEMVDGSDSLQ
jgi:hypothetical protein